MSLAVAGAAAAAASRPRSTDIVNFVHDLQTRQRLSRIRKRVRRPVYRSRCPGSVPSRMRKLAGYSRTI